jgi:hypothetical protein
MTNLKILKLTKYNLFSVLSIQIGTVKKTAQPLHEVFLDQ